MDKLRFGPAGIPSSTDGDTLAAVAEVRKLGLDSMELEFVRNVNISKEKAPLIKEAAKKNDVALTAHGSYFINLNSQEKEKQEASKKRLLDGAGRLYECGGLGIAFHAAYYMQQDKAKVYEKVKQAIKEITKVMKNEGNTVIIRPEYAGKISQFGDVDELLKLSTELEQVQPCIDFAHVYARSIGKTNSQQQFEEMLAKMEKMLGKEGMQSMHIHMSGIEYSNTGERNHVPLNDKSSGFQYKEVLKAWKSFKIRGTVACESPLLEKDALVLQKAYAALK